MIKNLTGGAVIRYGVALPAPNITQDGTLFFKTSGTDKGLYVYNTVQDVNLSLPGDQTAQAWTPAVASGLQFDEGGAILNVSLRFTQQSHVIYCNNYAQVNRTGTMAMFSDADFQWRKDFRGLNTIMMQLSASGILTVAGNTVWHAGNQLQADVGKLNGQPGSFYQNASNLNAGTLAIARLPFMPVQQGGGTGQLNNKVYIGYSNGGLLNLQVDSTNFAANWPISVTGNSDTSTYATSAGSAQNANFAQNAQEAVHAVNADNATAATTAQRALQADNATNAVNAQNATNATNAGYATNAGNASTATTAGSVPWTGVSNRPTNVSQFVNDAGYITLAQVPPQFPAGTRLLFQQGTPPVGWYRDTNSWLEDAGLRVVSGASVGSGGAIPFSTAFSPNSFNVSMTSLTVAQLPPHSHATPLYSRSGSADTFGDGGGSITRPGHRTESEGSGEGHTHSLAMHLKYVDVVVGVKL